MQILAHIIEINGIPSISAYPSKRLFDEKYKRSEILFHEDAAISINELQFPTKTKEKAMWWWLPANKDIEGDIAMQPEDEPALNRIAQKVLRKK